MIHQTMNHPPTAFAALFVCGSGILLFTLLAFSEFFQRKVPEEHYERVFFDRVLVTRRCKASASCDSVMVMVNVQYALELLVRMIVWLIEIAYHVLFVACMYAC
jgi:hypothetical protein